jgi:hypothetical protein
VEISLDNRLDPLLNSSCSLLVVETSSVIEITKSRSGAI